MDYSVLSSSVHYRRDRKLEDIENWCNKCLEKVEIIKVAEASRIKNEGVQHIKFTILLRIRSVAMLLLPLSN